VYDFIDKQDTPVDALIVEGKPRPKRKRTISTPESARITNSIRRRYRKKAGIETLASRYFAQTATRYPRIQEMPKTNPSMFRGSKTVEGQLNSNCTDRWQVGQTIQFSPSHRIMKWDIRENDIIYMRVTNIVRYNIDSWAKAIKIHMERAVPGLSLEEAYKVYVSIFFWALDTVQVTEFRRRGYTGTAPSPTVMAN